MSSFAKKVEKRYNLFFEKITTNKNGIPNIFSPVFLTHYYIIKTFKPFLNLSCGIFFDIGSGNKPYSFLFNNHIKKYKGMDYRKIALTEGYSKPEIYGDGQRIPLKKNSVDTILCTQVLQYIQYPDCLIKEIGRIIKPDGYIFLNAPQSYPVHHREYDYYRFTRNGIRDIFERNDLKIISLEQNGAFWLYIAHMFTHYFTYRIFRNVPGYFLKSLFGLLKIVLTPLILLFNVICNTCALLADKFDIEDSFTLNYTVIAKKEA